MTFIPPAINKSDNYYKYTEGATGGVLWKKKFLKIS